MRMSARLAYTLIAVVLLSTLFLSGCSNQKDSLDTVVINGSTTILPIAEEAAEQFTKKNPGTHILVSGMGSSAGIESASAGTAQIGTSSRDLKDSEAKLGLTGIPIANDGIAPIVNKANSVSELTTDELRDIFSGKITNWKEVGGPDLRIELVNRDEASGTREAFAKIVMGKQKFDRGAVVLPGTGQVREVVGRTKGAIGYISVGFVNNEVKALTVDGVAPTRENVAIGFYPISRSLYFFVKGTPSPLTQQYIDFVLSPAIQEGPVHDAGFVAVKTEEWVK